MRSTLIKLKRDPYYELSMKIHRSIETKRESMPQKVSDDRLSNLICLRKISLLIFALYQGKSNMKPIDET